MDSKKTGAMKLKLPTILLATFFAACTPLVNAQSWTLLGPPSRHSHSAIWDPVSAQMIIFGGLQTFTNTDLNDVWLGKTGTNLNDSFIALAPTGTSPQGRYGHIATYDPNSNRMTIFGGGLGLPAPCANDVWIPDAANARNGTPNWIAITPSGTAPVARIYSGGVYDPSTNSLIVFGGSDCAGGFFNDVWVLSNANGEVGTPAWTQLATAGTPPAARESGSVVYDSVNNILMTYGCDAGELQGANGICAKGFNWFLGGPPVRYSHASFYDSVTGGLFVFAGAHSGTLLFNDYWKASNVISSSNLTWTQLLPKGTKPSSRFGHTGLYDSTSNRLMVFGGGTSSTCFNDYHVLQNANTQGGTMTCVTVTPPRTLPGVRMRHASVYDSSTNTLIIFGGFNCAGMYYNDVWTLSNANDLTATPNWTQLPTTGAKPTVRQNSSAIYDPTTNSLIIYGGDKGGTPTGDIWILANANGTGGSPIWTQLTPSNSGPVARSGHTATYDVVNNLMTIYAGYSGTAMLSDTWVLSGANGQAGTATWTQLASGQIRRYHSSVYDPASNQQITFGGATGTKPLNPSSDGYSPSHRNGLEKESDFVSIYGVGQEQENN